MTDNVGKASAAFNGLAYGLARTALLAHHMVL